MSECYLDSQKLRHRDRYGHYPAHIAVKSRDLIGLQMLTSASASRNLALKNQIEGGGGGGGKAGAGRTPGVDWSNGADIFMDKDQYNNYALHHSAMENYPHMMDYMLSLDNRY